MMLTEEVLEWFNNPHASAHPRCEVICQVLPNHCAILLHPCFVEASLRVEKTVSCLKAGRPTALLLSFRDIVTCSMQISYCKQGTLRTRLRTGVCENLLLDVVVPEAHQNDSAMVSGHTFCSLGKNLAW